MATAGARRGASSEPPDTLELVLAFARRFGEPHTALAMHAALPLGLTPEIVHLIRFNFVPATPWIAEADLLLSQLCKEVGGDLYEMDFAARELLLGELRSDPLFGPARVLQVARLLAAYSHRALQRERNGDLRDFLEAQQWTAQAYLDPRLAAASLSSTLGRELKRGEHQRTARVVAVTRALAAPLLTEDRLLLYAAAVEKLGSGDREGAADFLGAVGRPNQPVEIGGVQLPAPGRLLRMLGTIGAAGAGEVPGIRPPSTVPGLKLLRSLTTSNRWAGRLSWSPDGHRLAATAVGGPLCIWDPQAGKLLQRLEASVTEIHAVAWSPDGRRLATGSGDGTIRFWDAASGMAERSVRASDGALFTVAWSPDGKRLACGTADGRVRLWEEGDKVLAVRGNHSAMVSSVAWSPDAQTLASASDDGTVRLWQGESGTLLRSFDLGDAVYVVAWSPDGLLLAAACADGTIHVQAPRTGRPSTTLEGHRGDVLSIAFSPDGRLLASRGLDDTLRLWSCGDWGTLALVEAPAPESLFADIAFDPSLPLLATIGERDAAIHLWQYDLSLLNSASSPEAVSYMTAKIVLVGDHSVGKSALGYRLIHGRFQEQASTHGQQFWVFSALGKRRADGTDCEAILWDFAGQPDYRLVHALFVDNADLALVLFDASDLRDPLHGVEFWLKQLQTGQSRCPIILVAAQTDRGNCPLTPEELSAFCQRHGIVGPIATSAVTGQGIAELVERMKSLIPWEDKPATVTSTTFKRIKDHVFGLKEAESGGQTIVMPEEIRSRLEATDPDWSFTEAEMLTAVGHLENYGYVKRLRTWKGELRILLQPERLNGLASSVVLEARRNPKGLGALEEKRLLAGGYDFPELKDLNEGERDVLMNSVVLLFLEHNICFRETDPLRMEPYLVFPELINLKKPLEEEQSIEDGMAYTVSGPTENVFASLVALLGYTHTFTRTDQWRNNARYEMGDGLVCGFRQEAERDGELDFVLCFGPTVGPPVRVLFQGLFESFLARRNLTVLRYEPVYCTNGHLQDGSVVRQWQKEGKTFAFCNHCGKKLTLPKMAEPIQLTREVQAEVETQRRAAEQRTLFEQALFRVRAYVAEQKITPPETFISYAWGVPEQERWVEKRLATDLQKAGIDVVLDRWHNAQIGANVARFIERIEKSGRIVVVGTPHYNRKYENKDANTGYVVAAEVDLINNRLLGTEAQKRSVLPLLLAGEKTESLPLLLHGHVHADFRDEAAYFTTAFDLILNLYQIRPNDSAVADLREDLRGPEMR